jgi:hypothetical protein
MPTPLEGFLLTIGLDATKFIKVQNETREALKKIRDEALKHGTDIEKSAKTFCCPVGKGAERKLRGAHRRATK